jgi:putative ABC transport system permease protein
MVTAALTFAVGIGAAVTMFTIVDNVLLRPLPYRESERLVQLGTIYPNSDRLGSVSLLNFEDIVRRNTTFEHLATVRGLSADLTNGGAAERVAAAGVSSSFFPILRVTPALGRIFLSGDDGIVADRTVIVSHGLWVRRWGGDPAIIGRSISLNDQPHTVIGILPPDFRPPEGLSLGNVDVWLPKLVPFLDRQLNDRSWGLFRVLGRVIDDRPIRDAQAEMDVIARALTDEFPTDNVFDGLPIGLRVVPLIEQTVADVRTTLWTLLGAVSVILLIAVANLVNLLVVRSLERREELLVKAALGSSAIRLIRPIVLESIMVTVVGGVIGMGVAIAGVGVFRATSPGDIPRLADVAFDWRIFAIAILASLTLGVVASLVPAIRSLKHEPADTLRGSSRAVGDCLTNRTRQTLVVVQAALAMALSAGAGLLINSFVRLSQIDPGFDLANVTVMQVLVANPAVRGSAARQRTLAAELLVRIRSMEGVSTAATTLTMPLESMEVTSRLSKGDVTFTTDDRPDHRRAASFITWISPDYFATMGIPFAQAGREFRESDTSVDPGDGIVIVNAELARTVWPGQSAVGRRIQFEQGSTFAGQYAVIGVVANARHVNIAMSDVPSLYFLDTGGILGPPLNVVVKSAIEPELLIPRLRAAVQAVDPTVPIGTIRPLSTGRELSVARPLFYTLLLSSFASAAVLLAAVGIYGAVAYSVARRSREVGLRLACGARPSRIVWLILRQGLLPVTIGVLLGLVIAAASLRSLSQFLYEVEPMDPLTLTAAACVLMVTAATACLVPSARAARIAPMESLRT